MPNCPESSPFHRQLSSLVAAAGLAIVVLSATVPAWAVAVERPRDPLRLTVTMSLRMRGVGDGLCEDNVVDVIARYEGPAATAPGAATLLSARPGEKVLFSLTEIRGTAQNRLADRCDMTSRPFMFSMTAAVRRQPVKAYFTRTANGGRLKTWIPWEAMDGEPGDGTFGNLNQEGDDQVEFDIPESVLRQGVMARITVTKPHAICALYGKCHGETRATLEFRDHLADDLRADPGGPYQVARGGVVALDGSRSTGVEAARWRLVARCPDTPAAPPVERDGPRVTVTVLCDLDATLTVWSGDRSRSATARVTVVPRAFPTPFEHIETEDPKDLSIPALVGGKGQYTGGSNVCAKEDDPAHTLHPGRGAAGSWRGSGYELMKVSDPGGPFDRWWYVGSYTIEISRKTLINKYILPGGPPCYRGDPQNFYDANKEHRADVDGYLAAVRAHEGLGVLRGQGGHSFLIRKELQQDDPGKRIEQMMDPASDVVLRDQVDALLGKRERELCQASKDPLKPTWGDDPRQAHEGELWFCAPTGGFVPGRTTVGGVGYGMHVCE